LGASLDDLGAHFAVRSATAERIWVALFDQKGDREIARIELGRLDDGIFSGHVAGVSAGVRYGLRADGRYDPDAGHWFDPDKLLVDPYATAIDRPYRYDPLLSLRRGASVDTASLVPKGIVSDTLPIVQARAPLFEAGSLIYEIPVRAFTMRHPDIPAEQRGTIAAIRHPAILAHLKKLGVGAVELMPVTAWIDERHLPPLGLANAWGYNPVTFMPLDPRLAPGGLTELRATVEALHAAGIGVMLDVVFNHTGESDWLGPVLSLRGLDNLAYYRHLPGNPTRLANDTGCGNTLRCDHPAVQELVLASLRHFVAHAGVDGFRFDLAPVLGRNDTGFDREARLLDALRNDPLLADRVLIAEPWDVGPGGYQLGNFGHGFLEWNDRFRDDVRRFWRGDRGMTGSLATRLSGSSDAFGLGAGQTRTVNMIAAHDGFTLADLVAFERKHNEANGEANRDGHNQNFSWNNGVEGETSDPLIGIERRRAIAALLSTLFAARGTIQLSAGDEFGRTQRGNNNAYAQDSDITWLDWERRDSATETLVAALSALRRASPALSEMALLSGMAGEDGVADVTWLTEAGQAMSEQDWNDQGRSRLSMVLRQSGEGVSHRIAVLVNGDRRATVFRLPSRLGFGWMVAPLPDHDVRLVEDAAWLVPSRTVSFVQEWRSDG